MDPGVRHKAVFWAIGWSRNPDPDGQNIGLLSLPLPWDEGETLRAAVLVFESRPLAEAGLDHYLALTDEPPSSYGLLRFAAPELVSVLEDRPEGGGFDRVALNPVPSRYFPGAVTYSAGWLTEEFVADLQSLSRDCC